MSTHSMRILILLGCLLLPFAPVRAATLAKGTMTVTLPDSVGEGQPFLAEIRLENQGEPIPSVFVEWLGKRMAVALFKQGRSFQGELLLGAGLGLKPGTEPIAIEIVGPRQEKVTGSIMVTATQFPEQRLTLPPAMVTPSKDNLARIKREQALIREAMAVESPARLWRFPFERPVPGVVTSAYGLRRVLNGQPRSQHRGIDFDAALGDDVHSAGPGKVILTGDFYYNGKSVFLDHGQGVITMYFHLSRIDVAVNQQVVRGQRLGLIGATGRVTGPHLHFGMNILGQSVDPMPLFAAGSIFDRIDKEGS